MKKYDSFMSISNKRNIHNLNLPVLSASQEKGMILRSENGIDIKYDQNKINTYKIVNSGDYVVHLRSFQGGFAFSTIDGICSPAYTILKCNPEMIEYGFFEQFFTSKKFIDSLRIVTYGIRDGRSISVEEFLNLKGSFPNKDEQLKIIKFYTLINKRIDTQNKIIEDLELFKKGIENQYFSCNKNNEYVILGDVITQINNRNEQNIDFEVLSVSNKYGFIPQSEQFDDHEVASVNKSNYKIVKQNDFAYNPARINVGSIAMLRNNQVGIVSPMYICFRANNNRILSSYLDYFSHSNKFNNEVLKNLEGSVRLCLSFESLSKIKIHLPSLDTQYEIVKNLDLISNKISIENKILEKLKEQKKYLLLNMFI